MPQIAPQATSGHNRLIWNLLNDSGQSRYLNGGLIDNKLLEVSTMQMTIWVWVPPTPSSKAAEVKHLKFLPRCPGSRTGSFMAIIQQETSGVAGRGTGQLSPQGNWTNNSYDSLLMEKTEELARSGQSQN